MKAEYQMQLNKYFEFSNLLNMHNIKHRDLVSYALLAYKLRFFELDESRIDTLEAMIELCALMHDNQHKKIDNLISMYETRNFFVASILTFFNRLEAKK